METLRERFDRFDAANPGVYVLFERFARQLLDAGRTRFSAATIFERIRWESSVATSDDSDRFKLNQNYMAYYKRKLMSDFPEFKGCFECRVLRAGFGTS